MPAANTAYFNANAANTATQIALNADGFTVSLSANVNTVNVRHVWIAFAGSDCSSTGTFCVGTYVGDDLLSQSINVGFQPDLVWTKASDVSTGIWRSSAMPDNVGQYF